MICYKDRSFCVRSSSLQECARALTEDVSEGAERAGLSLSMFDCGGMCDAPVDILDTERGRAE